MEDRILRLEQDVIELRTRPDRFLDALEKQSNTYLEALRIQANSLSIPLLRDVLVPIMMKVFSFFAALVFALLAGVFGIRWALGDWSPSSLLPSQSDAPQASQASQ